MNRRGFLAFLISAPLTSALPWKKIANVIAPIAPVVAADIHLSIDEIVSATIRNYSKAIEANVSANNALLKRLKEKR